jgi:hypothetical protein
MLTKPGLFLFAQRSETGSRAEAFGAVASGDRHPSSLPPPQAELRTTGTPSAIQVSAAKEVGLPQAAEQPEATSSPTGEGLGFILPS